MIWVSLPGNRTRWNRKQIWRGKPAEQICHCNKEAETVVIALNMTSLQCTLRHLSNKKCKLQLINNIIILHLKSFYIFYAAVTPLSHLNHIVIMQVNRQFYFAHEKTEVQPTQGDLQDPMSIKKKTETRTWVRTPGLGPFPLYPIFSSVSYFSPQGCSDRPSEDSFFGQT